MCFTGYKKQPLDRSSVAWHFCDYPGNLIVSFVPFLGRQICSEVCMVTRVKIISRFLAEMPDVEKLVYKHNFVLTEYLLVVFYESAL